MILGIFVKEFIFVKCCITCDHFVDKLHRSNYCDRNCNATSNFGRRIPLNKTLLVVWKKICCCFFYRIERLPSASPEDVISFQTSRYRNEFQELGRLGKGGYGSVCQVRESETDRKKKKMDAWLKKVGPVLGSWLHTDAWVIHAWARSDPLKAHFLHQIHPFKWVIKYVLKITQGERLLLS